MDGCWGKTLVLAIIALLPCTGAFAAGINTDAVNELTPDAGVTVDGVAIKDGKATGASTSPSDAGGTFTTKDYVGIPRQGTAHVVVQTTDAPAANAANLLAAYTAARALTPNGAALSATNRAVVIVPPGAYDLGGSTFTLDADFVDIEGLSNDREKQCIYRNGHVLTQTASDVRIANLLLHYTGTSSTVCAYYPHATWNDGTNHYGSPPATMIRNCEFRVNNASNRSMGTGVEYAGTYEDCVANGYANFGGDVGKASGKFTGCTGGDYAFGGDFGTASGTFTGCTGGNDAFGGFSGKTSGTFTGCTGGSYSFGGFGGNAAGGKFYHCVGAYSAFTESGVPAPVHLFCIQDGAQYSGND